MDDSYSSSNDLDLNPDLMTTQTGVPTVLSSRPTSLQSPVPGIIDITPGAPEVPLSIPKSQHVDVAEIPNNKIIDITPDGPVTGDIASEESTSLHLSDMATHQSATSELTPMESTAPLGDILHEVTSTAPTPISTREEITPNTETSSVLVETPNLPTASPITTITPVVTELPGPSAVPVTVPETSSIAATSGEESISDAETLPAIVQTPALPASSPLGESTQSTPPPITESVAASTSSPVIPTVAEESPSIKSEASVIPKDESSPVPELNPLFEDPDLVKLIK